MDFPFTDTTNFNVCVPHRNVVQVIQVTEHAYLTKLRNSRQQSELDAAVQSLQHPVKRFQHIAKLTLQGFIADGLQHRFIILVHKDDDTLACLLISQTDDMVKPFFRRTIGVWAAIGSLPDFKIFVQFLKQRIGIFIVTGIQIKMQHRIIYPLLFQLLHRQSGEQFLLPLKIRFEGGNQQALSETTRTAQEIITACLHHLINQSGFINIEITIFTYLLEILNTDRINLAAHTHCFLHGLRVAKIAIVFRYSSMSKSECIQITLNYSLSLISPFLYATKRMGVGLILSCDSISSFCIKPARIHSIIPIISFSSSPY